MFDWSSFIGGGAGALIAGAGSAVAYVLGRFETRSERLRDCVEEVTRALFHLASVRVANPKAEQADEPLHAAIQESALALMKFRSRLRRRELPVAEWIADVQAEVSANAAGTQAYPFIVSGRLSSWAAKGARTRWFQDTSAVRSLEIYVQKESDAELFAGRE